MSDDMSLIVDFGEALATCRNYAEESIDETDCAEWNDAWKKIFALLDEANTIYEESGLIDR